MKSRQANNPHPELESHDSSPVSLASAALIISFVAVAGSLWLSIGMGLKACPLCIYQRSFAMAALAVLLMGRIANRAGTDRGAVMLLTLPLAVAGCGVAAFHVYLESSGKLECPAGVWGMGTAPQQSLVILLSLLLALSADSVKRVRRGNSIVPVLIGVLLGGLLVGGSIASAPPLPKAPEQAYPTPLDTCRPPFRQAN